MRSGLKKIYLSGLFAISLYGCSDIIESSVEDKKVMLLAPADQSIQHLYNQKFWWEKVEDAFKYRVQIVSPSFDSIVSMVCDSMVSGNQFSMVLTPGIYQWRVRGENGSSYTAYSTRTFRIDTASLADQQILLKSPSDHSYTALSSANFEWYPVFGAGSYRVQIDTLNFTDEANMLVNMITSASSFSYSFPVERAYQWRVRAEYGTEHSQWSVVNHISYDHTAPEAVTLLTPANNQAINKPASLSWNTLADAYVYKVYVYKQDSVTAYTSSFPISTTATAYSFNSGNTGERIVWRVRAVDKAGNEGAFSAYRSFTVLP